MPYGLKLALYALPWCIAAAVIGHALRDTNIFIVFGIALLMAVAGILIGRRLFGRKGFGRPLQHASGK